MLFADSALMPTASKTAAQPTPEAGPPDSNTSNDVVRLPKPGSAVAARPTVLLT